MFYNELHQGGIRALLDYDNTLFDLMQLPEGVELEGVVDNIIYRYGDTPLFTPDPEVMKYYIKVWSRKRLDQWKRFKDAIEIEYAPLENYDRIEEGSGDRTPNITREQTISADNSSDYQPDNKNTETGKEEYSNKLRAHGNIGVTTSQQMLQSEIDLIPILNVYDFIANDFRSEFCLDIYY